MVTLPWLPPVSDSFRDDLKRLREAVEPDEQLIRLHAASRLNLAQLHALSRTLAAKRAVLKAAHLKMSVLANGTSDMLVPALVATAPRHGVFLDVEACAFGSYMQEALNPESATNSRANDFVLLALDHRAFDLQSCAGDSTLAERRVADAVDGLRRMVTALRSRANATVIVQTLAPIPEAEFGNLDSTLPGTSHWLVGRFNETLRGWTESGVLLLDVAALAANVGLQQWHNLSQWYIGKFSFAHDVLPLYADHVCRLVMAARGRARKCLVLDLDNTLWGGVIGDDGMSGILLGQGSPLGEAFLSVQAAALALRSRGVILAVSSKNDEAIARQVFREHPDMLLREEHLAVFQANWQDKATNIRAIAQTLEIGLDSLVLLDDNPAERQQVRQELPMVAVPDLPDDPAQFARLLLCAGYFESLQLTAEDRARAGQYQANAARTAALGAVGNLDDFLESLQMEAEFAPFDQIGRARITQLINKTNQFNLTTIRYSEAQVAALESDSEAFTLQVRLKDRFGDNGMVSVVICRREDDAWLFDTWLMSCRVLNRCLENQVLNVVSEAAKSRGVRRLIGIYRRSEKNGLVRDHYLRLGFTALAEADDESRWSLVLDDYRPVAVPIRDVSRR